MNVNNLNNNFESSSNYQPKLVVKNRIKAMVYGIINKKLPKRDRRYSLENNKRKYGPINTLDTEIKENKLGKIIERVITQYLLEHKLIKTGELTQERHALDFIMKVGNIKIGTDFTINSYHINEEAKKIKVYNSATHIDNGSSLGSTSKPKTPDITGFFLLNLNPKMAGEILNGFNTWKEKEYNGYWIDYCENNYDIDNFLNSYIGLLKNGLNKIFEENITEYFGIIGNNSMNITKKDHTYKITIKDKNTNAVVIKYYIYLTNKYNKKIGESDVIQRIPLIKPKLVYPIKKDEYKFNGTYSSETIRIEEFKKSKSA